jgi:hypothetical protein
MDGYSSDRPKKKTTNIFCMIISMFFPEIIILTIVFESYCPAISTISVKKMKNISKEVSEASWLIKKGHNSLKPFEEDFAISLDI